MSKKKKQELKEYQKNYRENSLPRGRITNFFSFHSIKMGQEVLYFGENNIIKSAFIKTKDLLILRSRY